VLLLAVVRDSGHGHRMGREYKKGVLHELGVWLQDKRMVAAVTGANRLRR